MMIPDDKIAEVRERAGIVEVIADYVSLKKSGANYLGLCPFHGEKTPSFNVNPSRGIFHCFGCGVGGNAVTFVMKMEGISFPEAVKLLAKRVGVVIEERPLSQPEKRRRDEREEQLRITALAAQYYGRILLKDEGGEAGRRYLAGRLIDSELFAGYRLGFASERWDGLTTFLEQQQISLAQVEKLGLIRKRSSGNGYYDLFRNRLIFTIANVHGQPIGFGGRVLDDSLPKYINSPESPVYAKSEVLFGIDLAKQAMRGERTVIIVEGYFDHLALYQAGIRNVVATCGTALTGGHVQLLKRYAERVYLLFDGDSAGRKATVRAMELLLQEGLPAFVIDMPPGEDPDSFLRTHSADEFAELLGRARPVLDYFLRELLGQGEAGTVAGKMAIVDQYLPMLQKLTDPVEKGLYLRELARVLSLDERTLRARIGKGQSPAGTEKRPDGRKQDSGAAEMLLALLGRYPQLARRDGLQELVGRLPAGLQPVAESLLATAALGSEPDWSQLLELVPDQQQRSRLVTLVVDDAHLVDLDPEKAFHDCCRALERQSLQQYDPKALRQELAGLDSDSPRHWEILKILNGLRNKKSQLL